jgi:hypothetical protein
MVVIPSVLFIFMLVCGPLMVGGAHNAMSSHETMGMASGAMEDCHGDHAGANSDSRGIFSFMSAKTSGALPGNHSAMADSTCCSIVCQGYALTSPQIAPQLFAFTVASVYYLSFIPASQTVQLYRPPKN